MQIIVTVYYTYSWILFVKPGVSLLYNFTLNEKRQINGRTISHNVVKWQASEFKGEKECLLSGIMTCCSAGTVVWYGNVVFSLQ